MDTNNGTMAYIVFSVSLSYEFIISILNSSLLIFLFIFFGMTSFTAIEGVPVKQEILALISD